MVSLIAKSVLSTQLKNYIFNRCSFLLSHFKSLPLTRNVCLGKYLLHNYEGDGQTTVTILNREYRHLVMIDTLSTHGFRLNNGIFVIGSIAVFPRTVLQWKVDKVEDITPESLSLFVVLEPKIDILIIGTGDKIFQPSKEVIAFLKSKKISVEVLPTQQACSTFNFLNVEGRYLAGVFLPPSYVDIYEQDQQLLLNPTAKTSLL